MREVLKHEDFDRVLDELHRVMKSRTVEEKVPAVIISANGKVALVHKDETFTVLTPN